MKLNLTESEVVDAILAAAEKKAEAPAPFSIAGSAAGMAAQIEGPTATAEQIREARARNRALFAADPAKAVLAFGDSIKSILGAFRALT